MKKSVVLSIAIVLVSAFVSLVVFAATPKISNDSLKENSSDNSVLNVVNDESEKPDETEVLKARFSNMLNHNFVYDETFDSVEDIVNNSLIALLDMKDNEEDSFIREEIVANYVYNMYGIEIEDFSLINKDMPKKEGYVFIIPRGYEIYSHEITDVSMNEDGSYTVRSNLSIATHDGQQASEVCETLFVKNEKSQFGFSMIYSNILLLETATV